MADNKNQGIKLSNDAELNRSEITGDVGPQRTNKSRRTALLGAIGVAGAASLPSEWKKPVIDGLVLPAHAQMSPSVMTESATTTIQVSQTRTVSGTAQCSKYITRANDVGELATFEGATSTYYAVTLYTSYSYATVCEDASGGTTVFSTDSRRNSIFQTVNGTSDYGTSSYSTAYTSDYGQTYTTFASISSYTTTITATTAVTVTN